MNNFSILQPARRFTWPDEKTESTQAEMQAAFLEDGFLICEGFASAQECADMIAQADKLIASFDETCLLYTSPSPRDGLLSRMPSSA